MNRRMEQRGFTLIELLLVLVILAVLAAVVVPKFTGHTKEARITAAKTDISNMETALDSYEIDTGGYPTSQQGLEALVESPAGVKGWKGPYVKAVPNDPWGNPYTYVSPGQHNATSYDISSAGPDGQGTEEVNNWSNGATAK